MEIKDNKSKDLNRDVNRIAEMERRIAEGRCDPSLCSENCPDCPMKLNRKGRRK